MGRYERTIFKVSKGTIIYLGPILPSSKELQLPNLFNENPGPFSTLFYSQSHEQDHPKSTIQSFTKLQPSISPQSSRPNSTDIVIDKPSRIPIKPIISLPTNTDIPWNVGAFGKLLRISTVVSRLMLGKRWTVNYARASMIILIALIVFVFCHENWRVETVKGKSVWKNVRAVIL
ncbi:4878_t:CDS:1 [Acaulospora morrowiae]|uniref:4878_t:CDS:1 n=1 Tax=Acaulospora morrowiae TaxID=94023 RepID=A0A9N9BL44_9GLOM|nr:4878_t:CDS:1 [Acaulospora morrowiae]